MTDAPRCALTAAEQAEIIEALEDEFDLLCLGRPSPLRIAEALQQAAGLDASVSGAYRSGLTEGPTTMITLLRLTTVPDDSTDERIPVLVPVSSIHFIHGSMPAAKEGHPGPREACTGVYMMQNGKPLFVSETLAGIQSVCAVGVPGRSFRTTERVDPAQYDSLIDCYRSGQIPEAAWTEHLRDQVFASYVAARTPQPT